MDIEKIKISGSMSVRDAIATVDRAGLGVALVVEPDNTLVGILTDGDIRRAILQNFDFSRSVTELQRSQMREFGPDPMSLPVDSSRHEQTMFLERYKLRHLPLTDSAGRLVSMVTREQLLGSRPGVRGVIMAGGFGTRLRPLTEETPKPMLNVGGKPILHRLVDQLKQYGIISITLVAYYKKEIIQEYFDDGSRWGLDIEYVVETEPRGTAGSLSHISLDDRLLLVTNGDIVTSLNFDHMEQFHRQNRASLTVAVAPYESMIPYGVVEMKEPQVLDIIEKPRSRHFVNAGIYLLSPQLCRFAPKHGVYNMTDLIKDSLTAGEPVMGFPIREYWRDIGHLDDFKQAELDVLKLV